MATAFQDLIDHLDRNALKYTADEASRSVQLCFSGEFANYRMQALVEDGEVSVFGWAPVMVPAGCRKDVAEAITRANFGMKFGSFDMDLDDGELRFKAFVPLAGDTLPDDLAKRLFMTTLAMLEKYLPAVMSVMYADESPKNAVSRAEAAKLIASGAPDSQDQGD